MNREKLPAERQSLTRRFVIGGEKGYLTVGLYEDGRPGELFVKMDQQGSSVSGFIDAWAISVSMLLQMGMPLDTIINKFRGMRFGPEGMTDDPQIRMATSPVDYIVRWLEAKFVDKEMFEDKPVAVAK